MLKINSMYTTSTIYNQLFSEKGLELYVYKVFQLYGGDYIFLINGENRHTGSNN